MIEIYVEALTADQWQRARELRLASLRDSSHAFGGNLELESAQSETEWRVKFEKLSYIVATVDSVDCAIMTVEKLSGDFGATAWVGGCWTNPTFRGKGLLRAMFDFVDRNALENGWSCHGLGVWEDNYSAIAAYEKLGFVAMGEPQESTRIPGKYYQRMIRNSVI